MGYAPTIVNMMTGKVIEIDAHAVRLSRMRRRISAWSEVVSELEFTRSLWKTMITLTYRPGVAWEKNHMKDFMKALFRRKEIKDNTLAYAWVAEMQERGAVHYHLYLIVEPGTVIPRPDESGMWPHGLSRIEKGRSPYYLISYMKKEYQKVGYPKGLRAFSVVFKAKDQVRRWAYTKFRWSALPAWLISELEAFGLVVIGLMPKPQEGGGWRLQLPPDRKKFVGWPTDEIEFSSPWQLFGRKKRG